MPMPQLLKKLSRKSLRKRTQSTPSVVDIQFELELPPPLPFPRSATSDGNFGYVLPNGSATPPTDPYPEKPCPPTPKTPGGPALANEELKAVEPQDDFSKDLASAWKSATTDPKAGKADKALMKLENGVAGAMAKEASGVTIMATIKTGLDAVGGLEGIEQGLNSFMDGMPVLMNALDEVAKLHPFIGVAVMAFKAVWALEQKRRDNDKKILTLHMEMKDMMAVLTQLKNVKDAEEVAPDACDTYVKKKLVVKILKSQVWDSKLADFAVTFTKRRSEFEFALAIHTSVGVDAANQKLGDVDKTTQAIQMKMDMMMKMFTQFLAYDPRMIEKRGGQACLENDQVLKELSDFENNSGSNKTGKTSNKLADIKDLADLKEDLHTDVEAALEKNMATFERKLEVQTRQITEEVNRIVKREGDRVINAITAGPGDKILDPDVHAIWKDMSWRSSVKTRHFVMALRDHFQDGKRVKRDQGKDQDEAPVVDKADEWALEYINVVRLQPISEAFDDDASGWVTVNEVNEFTTSRPLDWSLPHWVAYWAIGHHQAMDRYVDKINELLEKMFAILPHIRQANKSAANTYLKLVYKPIYTLIKSLNPCYVGYSVSDKFQSYIASEEARIRGKYYAHSNLESVKYDIDEANTLQLVTGQGRIDKFVLPVIYLLLERHFEIFRVCQSRTAHSDELLDAADTLEWVFDAVNDRLFNLQSIFKQQKLELKSQFKSFSHGLYECMNEPDLLWDDQVVLDSDFVEIDYHDKEEGKDLDANAVLNYPFDRDLLDFNAYAIPEPDIPDAATPKALPAVEGMLGLWHGFRYGGKGDKLPKGGMFSMVLKPSSNEGGVQYFTAADRSDRTEFKVVGQCRAGDEPGTVSMSFKRTDLGVVTYPTNAHQYYTGKWDATKNTLTGTFGSQENPATHYSVFVFKRTVPEYMCFTPAPVELETNKARALWGFAIAAVRYGVRRDRWSWSFFKERRDHRLRYLELYIRSDAASTRFGQALTDEEEVEFGRLQATFTTATNRFYHSLGEQQIRATIDHNVMCDTCNSLIGGARITCLVCKIHGSFNTVDFCETPVCITTPVARNDLEKVHMPHHGMMKLRRVLHTRQVGHTFRKAKEALEVARTFFKSPTAGTVQAPESESESEVDTDDEEGHAPLSANPRSRVPVLAVSIPQTVPSGGPRSANPASGVSVAVSPVPDPISFGPPCRSCNKPVSQPCWYCVQCGGEAFICWECDLNATVSFGRHNSHHDLVRVQPLVEEKELTMEERFTQLEGRFAMQEKTLHERFGRVEGRMAKMEHLLEQILVKLGTS
ncbi:hypothetical protein DFH07DRAFT_976101 [Mycena maculata]|uniref:Vacuolar protein sorting-associated protein 13 second N-terminal domain-containing protein n=1 Tax=Mycena maculata TaxID=230809 RepID=A0AAD7KGW9_9AGAR|nr:hypothetical protein DFH07DRAFT_976101 [Mycena maculata]